MSDQREHVPDGVDEVSWADPNAPEASSIRGYVTGMTVDVAEIWMTLNDGTTIHRRLVDGVWEDVEE